MWMDYALTDSLTASTGMRQVGGVHSNEEGREGGREGREGGREGGRERRKEGREGEKEVRGGGREKEGERREGRDREIDREPVPQILVIGTILGTLAYSDFEKV
jgi:hypothetical protein